MTKSSKSSRSAKNASSATIAPVEALVLNHTESIEPDAGELALSDLIASLDAPEADEVVEPVVSMTAADLDAAVSSAEATEATISAATPTGVVEAAAVPTGDVSDVVTVTEAAPEKPAKVKKVATPRKHYTDKVERLKDRMGADLPGYSVLTLADAGVTEGDLSAVTEATMVIIRAMSGKAQNWAVKLVEALSGKKASMSEVTARIFKLLQKDGFITTGATGNLYLDLIAKPYSPGAARAMGGNNLAMMMALRILDADGKGRFVPNEDSLLLMKARSVLFGTPSEEDAELEVA